MAVNLTPIRPSFEYLKAEAKHHTRLVYAAQTPWWKLGDPVYNHPEVDLPCGPRSEMLLETDNPLEFIEAAENNPDFYGKHGLKAFTAAYHGSVVADNGLPTSLDSWDGYNELLDEEMEDGL